MESLYIPVLFAFVALVFAGVYAWKTVKQSQITETVALYKVTEDGESITTQLSFRKGETFIDKSNRIAQAFKLGEERRAFLDARFKAHLEEERAKQDAERQLKSV